VNGINIGNSSLPIFGTDISSITFGDRGAFAGTAPYVGLLAEIYFWNRALKGCEVLSTFGGSPPSNGIVSYWKGNLTGSGALSDAVGGRDAPAVNGPISTSTLTCTGTVTGNLCGSNAPTSSPTAPPSSPTPTKSPTPGPTAPPTTNSPTDSTGHTAKQNVLNLCALCLSSNSAFRVAATAKALLTKNSSVPFVVDVSSCSASALTCAVDPGPYCTMGFTWSCPGQQIGAAQMETLCGVAAGSVSVTASSGGYSYNMVKYFDCLGSLTKLTLLNYYGTDLGANAAGLVGHLFLVLVGIVSFLV
jgi:hypothetical protein